MFNYFLIAPSNAYSLTTLSTETVNQQEPQQDRKVPEEEYSNLLERYDKLKGKYENIKQENLELKEYINELQDVFQPDTKKKKIRRRTESELSKEHSCPYQNCKKQYASMLALNLHIRNKHDGGTKKERIAYIKQLIEAEEKGLQRPQIKLNICPELLQREVKSYRQKLQIAQSDVSPRINKEVVSSQFASDQ